MNNNATAILDAAERRIRMGGFDGFSFRDIAADVSLRSSSVHYHFPTKDNLTAAVIRRYTEWVSETIEQEFKKDPDPIRVWTRIFRGTVYSEDRMCPATVLGAASLALPVEVSAEVKGFFQMCLDKLAAQGLSARAAAEFLSTLIGALVTNNALGDPTLYDLATGGLKDDRSAAIA